MADYPSIEYTSESSVQTANGMIADRGSDGTLRARITFDSEKLTWSLVHIVDYTDADTLQSHFAANQENTFSFTDQETTDTHTVVYGSAPSKAYPSSGLVRYTVKLEEV